MEVSTSVVEPKLENEEPVKRTGFLADAKRFNAQRIRQRMREQKDRFTPKMSATDTNTETPTAQSISSTTQPVPTGLQVQLTTAVTMSEDEESPRKHYVDNDEDNEDYDNDDEDDDEFNGNASTNDNDMDKSAWAMMEHYGMNSPQPKAIGDEASNGRISSSFWDRALDLESFSMFDGEEQPSMSTSKSSVDDISQQVFVPRATESLTTAEQGDDNINIDNKNNNQFRTPSASSLKQVTPPSSNVNHTDLVPWKSTAKSVGRTPARLRAHWIEEKENTSMMESPPTSLLQESLILSDDRSSTASAFHSFRSVDDSRLSQLQVVPTVSDMDDPTLTTENQSKSQFSTMAQSDKSTRGRIKPKLHVNIGNAVTPVNKMNETNTALLQKHIQQQIDVIQPNASEQRGFRLTRESQLQERVKELEQALKASVSTPRGTIVNENPLKTLLDRNQTLVKEVRFADSTCVELSTKIAAMEAERQIMQNQLRSLENENRSLRDKTDSIASFRSLEDEGPLGSFTMSHTQSNMEVSLRQIMDDLKTEVSALAQERKTNTSIISSASILLADMEHLDQNNEIAMNQSNTSACLAKALQLQVELMKEQSKLSTRTEELEQELDLAKLENNLIREDMEKIEKEDFSLGIAKAEQESDFLGRQLGHVQERLDQTLAELKEERKNSKEIDRKWRSEAKMYLTRIGMLEQQLRRVADLDQLHELRSNVAIDNAVSNVEFELDHFKDTLKSFKSALQDALEQDFQVDSTNVGEADPQILLIIQTAVQRFKQQISRLHGRVDVAVDSHCHRLNKLTNMVGYLRSSLLFEAESVSTGNQDSQLTAERTKDFSPSKESIPDDELFERMEEARDQPSHVRDLLDDASSDLDDLSRLFQDDSTLELILKKANSEGQLSTNLDALRKPLEAAMRECQRVKERSLSLKEELQSEKIAFQQLEEENKRLVKALSQQGDDNTELRHELEECKSKCVFLERQVSHSKQDLQRQINATEEMETKYEEMQNKAHQLTTEKNDIEYAFAKLTAELDSMRDEVQSLAAAIENKEDQVGLLLARVSELETHTSEAEDRLLEAKLDQENMRKERAELKSLAAQREKEVAVAQENVLKLTTGFENELKVKDKKIEEHQLQVKQMQDTLQKHDSLFEELYAIAKASSEVLPIETNPEDDSEDGESTTAFGRSKRIAEAFALAVGAIVESRDMKKSVEEELLSLKQDFEGSHERSQQYRQQIGDEKTQNLKLLELLRQAELEMERSAHQIREMSAAMSKLQQQEVDLINRTKAAEEESEKMRKESEVKQINHMNEHNAMQKKLNEMCMNIRHWEKQSGSLQSQVELLEKKNSRLREYVKKLTLKCEEWESTYETQADAVEKLQAKNARLRAKSATIAAKYKSLASQVKSRDQTQVGEAERWDVERNDLQRVHEQLEKELELITRELEAMN